MKLPDVQVAVLEAASPRESRTLGRLAAETDFPAETVAGAAFELADEGFLTVTESTTETVELTPEGREYVGDGLPEHRLYEAARECGATGDSVAIDQVLTESDVAESRSDIALSNYLRKGYGDVERGELTANPDADPESDAEAAVLADLADGNSSDKLDASLSTADDTGDADDARDQLVRRGLLTSVESTVRSVRLEKKGITALMAGVEREDTVSQVTPELLQSGSWRDVEFAEYDVTADAGDEQGGSVHILRQIAERVTDVLVCMGFEEMDGPHVDADFWINDALFMPQDHPTRTHWNQFTLADPRRIEDLPDDLVARVRDAHLDGVDADGEGYQSAWSRDTAAGLTLRGHTTSLSMRYLSGHARGELDPPQRLFCVGKAYRNDTLDPTHLLEFFQVEGLVMAEDLSARDLMGTFDAFYAQFGIHNIRYKPHYNPYTEPSFELFVDHPTTGEQIELGNSGLFRPDVRRPLGVECDVMAWGISLGRLLMVLSGFTDIRDVHGPLADLKLLRETPGPS